MRSFGTLPYRWRLVGVVVFILAVVFGPIVHGAGLFMLALKREFGWSQSVLSVPFSLNRAAEGALLGPLEGYLTDRLGPRRMVLVGIAVLGAGFVLFSTSKSILGYYASIAIVWGGAGLAGFIPLMTAINNWFVRHRATAMAIAQSGVNLGGLLVPAIAWAMAVVGWRKTALWIGIGALLIAIPVSRLVQNRPEESTLKRFAATDQAQRTREDEEGPSFTVREALRTRAFWTIALAHSFAAAGALTVILFLVPSLVQKGMSAEMASTVVTIYTLTAVVAQLAGGVVGDRYPKHLAIAGFMVIQATGVLIAALGQSTSLAFLAAILFGIGYGGRNPLLVSIRSDYFGKKHFGTIIGFGSVPVNIMSATPIVAGYLFDSLGSYTAPFLGLAGLTLLGSLCALLSTRPERPKPPIGKGAK